MQLILRSQLQTVLQQAEESISPDLSIVEVERPESQESVTLVLPYHGCLFIFQRTGLEKRFHDVTATSVEERAQGAPRRQRRDFLQRLLRPRRFQTRHLATTLQRPRGPSRQLDHAVQEGKAAWSRKAEEDLADGRASRF